MTGKWRVPLAAVGFCALLGIGLSSCKGGGGGSAEIAALKARVDSLETRLRAQYDWNAAMVRSTDAWKVVLEKVPGRGPEPIAPPPPPPRW